MQTVNGSVDGHEQRNIFQATYDSPRLRSGEAWPHTHEVKFLQCDKTDNPQPLLARSILHNFTSRHSVLG